MLTRIRVEKLVVMEQQRCELLDWAMMDISRLGRSPIFLGLVVVFVVVDGLRQLWFVIFEQ